MPDPYDLLLVGGDVLDPGGGHTGRLDVAVRDGRIAAIGPGLGHAARTVVEIAGRLVTPGLVDLHTHVHPGAGYWGIDPDPIAWYTGVTTWVDAGSAGAYTLDGLRDFAAGRQVRVAALLNVSGPGLAARTGECRDLSACDVAVAIDTVLAHRDLIRGVKVRVDAEAVGGNGVEPLRRALAVADACGVPVMVHIGAAPPAAADVLDLLRPGDIVTHCASGIATPLGPSARAAYERGVLFDLGHGSGGFAFDVLEAQLDAGLRPYSISTDLHARSVYGPVFDLPTTMAKLLAVGMSLPDVVAAATAHPARALRLDAGTLTPGAPADLAVFAVEPGEFEVVDAHRQTRRAPLRLVNEATYVAGRRLGPRLPASPPSWIPLTDAQHAALRHRERDVRALLGTPLVGVDGLAEQFPRPPRPTVEPSRPPQAAARTSDPTAPVKE
ncbi:amidohydrolase/deacetylase family metallohydrolase [Krasilnikovia sp. M28-CT-15]|uniref:amidohydrolase/deacetylase family metallohydrolase n=1 Tax=Krasilnikovia sp. M28-CT-15 TaxID=3373540 RepID=UPI0038773B60